MNTTKRNRKERRKIEEEIRKLGNDRIGDAVRPHFRVLTFTCLYVLYIVSNFKLIPTFLIQNSKSGSLFVLTNITLIKASIHHHALELTIQASSKCRAQNMG